MDERKQLKHNISLKERKLMDISGIINVEKFNDTEVVLETSMGMLTIKGENMHMKKLNLDNGELTIDGTIKSYQYSELDVKQKGKGFLSKLLK